MAVRGGVITAVATPHASSTAALHDSYQLGTAGTSGHFLHHRDPAAAPPQEAVTGLQYPWSQGQALDQLSTSQQSSAGHKRKFGNSSSGLGQSSNKRVSFNSELEVLGGSTRELDRIVEANMKVSKVRARGY